MIPYLLAVLGGYLIGGSRKEYKKGGKVASSKYTDGGMPSFYPDLEKRAKRAYDYLYKTGSQHMYPELKGDWEEDKDFWIEEYLDRMEKRDD